MTITIELDTFEAADLETELYELKHNSTYCLYSYASECALNKVIAAIAKARLSPGSENIWQKND